MKSTFCHFIALELSLLQSRHMGMDISKVLTT